MGSTSADLLAALDALDRATARVRALALTRAAETGERLCPSCETRPVVMGLTYCSLCQQAQSGAVVLERTGRAYDERGCDHCHARYRPRSGHSRYCPACQARRPWRAGRVVPR